MGSILASGVLIDEPSTKMADYPMSASTHLKHSASIYSGLNRNSSAKFGDLSATTPRPARLEGSNPRFAFTDHRRSSPPAVGRLVAQQKRET